MAEYCKRGLKNIGQKNSRILEKRIGEYWTENRK
jgi:hypothetical protein